MCFQPLLTILLFVGLVVSTPAVAKKPDGAGGDSTKLVGRSQSSGGTYLVEIRSTGPIPLNEIFSLEFRTFDAAAPAKPIKNARITVSTWMPAHQHGGNLEPQISYRDEDSAWGEGFLFHMEGLWQLRIGVMANGLMERVVFDIDMEP